MQDDRQIEVTAPRKAALRPLGIAFLYIAATAALTCVVVRVFGGPILDREAVVRPEAVLANLDRIAALPGETVLFFGGSTIELGVSPALLDAELKARGKTATSFNLGFGFFNPSLLRDMAEHVRAAQERAHRKLAVSVVSFDAVISTQRRRQFRQNVETDVVLARLATPALFRRWFREDPLGALKIFTYRYGFGGLAPQGVVDAAAHLFPPPPPNLDLVLPPNATAEMRAVADAKRSLRKFLGAKYPDGLESWTFADRGYVDMDSLPDAQQWLPTLVRSHQTHEEMAADLEERRDCCDIENLRFDEAFLDDYVAILQQMKAVSEHTVIMIFPRNRFVYSETAAGQARMSAAIERLKREAQVDVIDLSTPAEIVAEDFLDTTHVAPTTGVKKLSALIATALAPLL